MSALDYLFAYTPEVLWTPKPCRCWVLFVDMTPVAVDTSECTSMESQHRVFRCKGCDTTYKLDEIDGHGMCSKCRHN